MQAALAVSGQYDRLVTRNFGNKIIKGGQDILIGGVQRLLAFGLAGQERAQCRLAIAGRPDIADRIERAGLAAQENSRPCLRFLVVQRRIPLVFLQKGGRVNEKDSRFLVVRQVNVRFRHVFWQPQGRVALDQFGTGQPHAGVGIDIGFEHVLGREFGVGHKGHFHQLVAIDSKHERPGDHQYDHGGDKIEKLAGQMILQPVNCRFNPLEAASRRC